MLIMFPELANPEQHSLEFQKINKMMELTAVGTRYVMPML